MANSESRASIPRIFHKLLPRGQFMKVMDDASLSEVVYMVAPYGYGKTLATLSWLRERNRRAAWITLEETDNTENAFARLIATAFSRFAVSETDKEILPCFQISENAHFYFTDAESFRDEDSFAVDTLVIDNFHFVKDEGLLRSIKDFAYSLLGHLRVIIMSRAELSPIFNDLVLKRHICLITAKELSFSVEEIKSYFDLNKYPVDHQSIMQIHSDTEGWPAAINVILMVSRNGAVEYGEDARAYVKDFFETEIWSGLSEGIRDFLLRTSVLDKLTPTACNALTSIGATLPILGWLFANGLFISKLERDTYRYHRVFSDFLLDKLESSNIDEKELFKKAAWWWFERNKPQQSFRYFFKARDLYGLNQVLKAVNPATLNSIDRFLEVADCLITLDINELKSYPIIVTRIALIEYLKGNIIRFQELYQTLIGWIDPGILPISPEEYAEYVWEVGWLCYLDPAERVDDNAKHREWCNYSQYVPHLKELHLSRAAVLRFPSVLRGIRDYCGVSADDIELVIESVVTRKQTPEGRFIYEEHSIWEMNLIFAEYLYESEEFVRSVEIVRRIMAMAEERRYTDFYFICTALLVKIMRATHNAKEIETLISRLEAMIMSNRDYFLMPNFHAFRLRNSLADGHIGLDAEFEKENRESVDKPYYHLLYRHVTFVRRLISTGNYNEAVLILNNLELLCQKYKRTMDLIEICILKSISLYGLGGHEEEACSNIIVALNEAKKHGFIRMFSDDAIALWPVLELAFKTVSDAFVKKVMLSCKKELMRFGQKPSAKKPQYTVLTKTEFKILKCLQMGMSYKDIEVDNDIRLSTVKSHVHSIYSKLDVNNRTAAIIAAQNQGILEFKP